MKNIFLILITSILLMGCNSDIVEGETWERETSSWTDPFDKDNGNVTILKYDKAWVKIKHIRTGYVESLSYQRFTAKYDRCGDCNLPNAIEETEELIETM